MMRARWRTRWPVTLASIMLAATAASAQYNVAQDRPFDCTGDVMDGWTGLVDGVTDSDSAPGCFATGNSSEFPKSVTIDLQRPCNINRVTVYNSANGNTRAIVIYCSSDGVRYEKLREFIFPHGDALALNHAFGDRPVQFVRVEFTNTWGGGLGGENTIFCREVEVFGSPTGGGPVIEPMSQQTGDPLVATRDLKLFRRWALGADGALKIAVLGDSLASCAEERWPQFVAEKLALVRPDGAQVSLTAMTEADLQPGADSGYVGLTAEAEPDVVLVTFGTDMREWDGERFRVGLTGLVRRLLDETDALVVLVGPAVNDASRVDIGRRALREMEKLADVLSLSLVRTEAALLRDGLMADDIADEDGSLSEDARRVVSTSVLELLLQPQI